VLYYLNLNKKLIGLEIFFISCWILYISYLILYGTHFIATHTQPLSF
jgi:hypothetical protein